MKLGIILLSLIYALSLSVATEGTAVSGQIAGIEWPKPSIYVSGAVQPWITILNTGTPISFSVRFSIQDQNGKLYESACWPTNTLGHETTVWPPSISITSAMAPICLTRRLKSMLLKCNRCFYSIQFYSRRL